MEDHVTENVSTQVSITDAEPSPVEETVEETLVEEVSIDGMCGVY